MALQGVPWGQFGNLLTVDRQEIESYRSIRNLVAEYAGQKQVTRPLSIAVFGTPGSGKSFGVTEMAKSLLPGQIEPITFNLSQFDSVADLLSALHQVRDVGLSGKLPLVFWDEFDTSLGETPLGWLRYFLAPMQDGKFQEGQISHPIGRAIFVFAGGTSSSMAEFDKGTEQGFQVSQRARFRQPAQGLHQRPRAPTRSREPRRSVLYHPPGDPVTIEPETRHASTIRETQREGTAEHRPRGAARAAEDWAIQARSAFD